MDPDHIEWATTKGDAEHVSISSFATRFKYSDRHTAEEDFLVLVNNPQISKARRQRLLTNFRTFNANRAEGFWARRTTIAKADVIAMKAAAVNIESSIRSTFRRKLLLSLKDETEDGDEHESEDLDEDEAEVENEAEAEAEAEAGSEDDDGGSADEADEGFFNDEEMSIGQHCQGPTSHMHEWGRHSNQGSSASEPTVIDYVNYLHTIKAESSSQHHNHTEWTNKIIPVFKKCTHQALRDAGKRLEREMVLVISPDLPDPGVDDTAIIKAVRLRMNNRREEASEAIREVERTIRLMFVNLLESLPDEADRSISEVTFTVNYAAPVLNSILKLNGKTDVHYPNAESSVQKIQGLKPDRPDILVKAFGYEIMYGEITGPCRATCKAKTNWDLFRLARFGKSFLDKGSDLVPLLQVVHDSGLAVRLTFKVRGVYLLER
ncbi:hypothetical protein DFQ26_008964, partial [Actinomortierella ambigua]